MDRGIVVERRIADLDRRVSRLEGASMGGGFFRKAWRRIDRFFSEWGSEGIYRLAGWFLMTATALSLWAEADAGQPFSVPVGVGLLCGIWLALKTSGAIKESESTRALAAEHRSGRRLAAAHLHSRPKVRSHAGKSGDSKELVLLAAYFCTCAGAALLAFFYAWLVYAYFANNDYRLVAYLFPVAGVLWYSLGERRDQLTSLAMAVAYAFFLFSQPDPFTVGALVGLTGLMAFYAWSRRWWALVSGLAFAAYAVMLTWAMRFSPEPFLGFSPVSWETAAPAIALATGFLVALFSLPLVTARRQADRGVPAKFLVFANTLFPLLLCMGVGPYLLASNWWLLNMMVLCLFAYCGCVAWMRHQRFSYAKYYFIGLVGSIAVLAAMQPDQSAVTTLWFMLAVLVLGIGFSGRMYAARLTGLGVLVLALLHYFLYEFLPAGDLVQPVLDQGRVWLGLLFVLFLFVIGVWYRQLPAGSPEGASRTLLEQGAYAASAVLFFSILGVALDGPAQTLLWGLLGALVWAVGTLRHYDGLQAVGLSLVLVCLMKLLLIDSLAYPPFWQVFSLAAGGALLIGAGVSLARRHELFSGYLPSNKRS